jgi:CheY-like chemotaxis protein
MTPALLPHDESGRLDILRALQAVDTDEGQDAFDAIARLLQTLSGCPITLVSLVDADQVWLKAGIGCPARHTPRLTSFCDHTIRSSDLLEVPDCSRDPRFADNPWVVGDPHVRFYAGAPVTVEGHHVGSVCVIDHEPRRLSASQRQALVDLATLTSSLLQARHHDTSMEDTAPMPLRVEMPVAVERERIAARELPEATPVAPARKGLRMLYVEDNRISAILFEEMLRTHNCEVQLRVAEDAAEAMSLARGWSPDVLVLDAHLPDATGFELLPMLRTLPGMAHVPAYMCSADAQPEDVQHAYAVGFIGYWTKPINIATVLMDIRQWTEEQARSAASA